MSWDINQVILIGRLTANPILRYSSQGNAYCQLGIAVGMRSFSKDRNSNAREDEVSFFNVTTFGKIAEISCEYLSKGKQVCVSGYLRQRRWEKDGQKFSFVDIVADRVQFLTPSSHKGGEYSEGRNESYSGQKNMEADQLNQGSLDNQDYEEDDFDKNEIPF